MLTIHLTAVQPLEWTVPHRDGPCYAKLICLKTEKERVIGFHVTGPNAGEMTQGYGVAMRYASSLKRKIELLLGLCGFRLVFGCQESTVGCFCVLTSLVFFDIYFRLGATKKDFDSTVGIHPTNAEVLVTLEVTKRSGLSVEKSAC